MEDDVKFFEFWEEHVGEDSSLMEVRLLIREKYQENAEPDVPSGTAVYIRDMNHYMTYRDRLKQLNEKGYEIYYGVQPRRVVLSKASDRTNIAGAYFLFADIDIFHPPEDKPEEEYEKELKEMNIKEEVMKVFEIVLDFLKKNGIPPTLGIYTGYGLQLLFVTEDPMTIEEFEKYQEKLLYKLIELEDIIKEKLGYDVEVDRKVKDPTRILRMPGFINHRYESIKPVAEIIYEGEDNYLNPSTLNTIVTDEEIKEKKIAMKKRENSSKSITSILDLTEEEFQKAMGGVADLDDEAKSTIVSIMKKYYAPGQRHFVALYLSGYLRKKGVSLKDAYDIITALASDDEEPDDRVRALADSYSKQIEELGGYTKLLEILGQEAEEDLKKIDELLFKRGFVTIKTTKELFEKLGLEYREKEEVKAIDNMFEEL